MQKRIRYFNNRMIIDGEVPENLDEVINYKEVNKCPACGQIWSIGELGSGTSLEIECRRCRLKNILIIP